MKDLSILRYILGIEVVRSTKGISLSQRNAVEMRYVKESEELRRAMEPLELIKRVREIEQETNVEPQAVQPKATKQTAAADLSKRLTNFRPLNDANSQRALEEWRKRKMERARQRELEKNGTAQA
ncbi:uncharacterized protein LOC122091919 isoform X2 [Macadamia integrifolia]|uniref:uncharacterized protein LOC122091919 isoform X2 n=1 Tax=Macadamia integrifolia TaxID=60698 RepID=UPI001C4E3736|nr:uncharacterized protein LOC122091919 isoform X2 [Macadamia integrifolia]